MKKFFNHFQFVLSYQIKHKKGFDFLCQDTDDSIRNDTGMEDD
jgi:hypothetical protein